MSMPCLGSNLGRVLNHVINKQKINMRVMLDDRYFILFERTERLFIFKRKPSKTSKNYAKNESNRIRIGKVLFKIKLNKNSKSYAKNRI